jgi:ParB family transcriptional regulator, chromosome partitioning protein
MSVKSRLSQLTTPVEPPPAQAAASTPADSSAAQGPRQPPPKTGPGAMVRFLQDQSDSDERIRELTDRLKSFEDALPVRRLDAARIRVSSYANRHEDHFKRSAAYQQLVEDISSAGGNVQPIRVRPVKDDPQHDFEVVFGHRRHRACQQLGLPVLAMISSDDDTTLFEAMCRENSSREDLSAFEEGMSYRRALELGLYTSQRKLASAVGVTQARISQVIAVASLPPDVLAAFPSPLSIQYRWAEVLHAELKTNGKRLDARLKDLAGQKALSAKQVFDYLTAKAQAASVDVVVDGKKRAVIRSAHGVISVAFSKNSLPEGRMGELQSLLSKFLSSQS